MVSIVIPIIRPDKARNCIDAIKAVVRDEIQTDEHPVGRDLAETLEARVAEHLG